MNPRFRRDYVSDILQFVTSFATESSHTHSKRFYKSFAIALIASVACIPPAAFSKSNETGEVSEENAAIFRFAVPSGSMTDTVALSSQACAADTSDAHDATAPPNNITVDPKVLDGISAELERKLSKKMSVMVDPDPENIPVGTLVISGCISKAQKGSVAGRMVGFGLGASRLSAHVVVLSKADTGFTPIDSFDLEVKGRFILPPFGPAGVAIHALRQPSKTLSADGKKLAGQVLKKLDNNMKGREQAGNPAD